MSGQDEFYIVLKCLSATIGNTHHKIAVLEHYRNFNAQEGTDAEGIVLFVLFCSCSKMFLQLFKF